MDDNKRGPTPATVRQRRAKMDPDVLYKSAHDDGYHEGFAEGRSKGRQEIIDWLERRYVGPGPDTPARNTPEARAILELAREASLYMKGLEPKPRRGRR